MKNLYLLFFGILLSCNISVEKDSPILTERSLAKFEPAGEKVLLFVGQDLGSIGGLDAPYNDGYLDHFESPGGFTMYSNLAPGDISFGFVQKGLDGIWSTADWGDSPSNMSWQLDDPDFENMALAIGLSLVNHEGAVAKGERDDLIEKMGNWFKELGRRPVFLRIAYEFDGHSWNHYNREDFITAFRRIKDKLDGMGVNNVAYVWQSTGWVSDSYLLEEWYPGDDYVDWCSMSFFARWREIEMYEFARKKGKPVFIAEASPTVSDHTLKFDGQIKEIILSDPIQADEAWTKWFDPFFNAIDDNRDVVKAISYINCNWRSHQMWFSNPTFQKVDARLQTSPEITTMWEGKIYKEKYLHSSPDLYNILWRD